MRAIVFLLGVLTLAACAKQQSNEQLPPASNETTAKVKPVQPFDPSGWQIVDVTGKRVGTVSTRSEKDGVRVMLEIAGLPAGPHGVHIHQVAKCESPTFESAGGHWNWTNKKHGHRNPKGYHAGDLGNLTVGPNGMAQETFIIATKDWDPKMSGGLPLIIHANADDEKTDPSGNSGERVACGIMYLRRG